MSSALPTARFTVLLPIHRGPVFVRRAIACVQNQSLRDFHLVVVGDGAPPATAEAVARIAANDPRVSYRAFPKGERHGEAHRHTVLSEADSEFVAYLDDDGLWFPNHLAILREMLTEADYGQTQHLRYEERNSVRVVLGSLHDDALRNRMRLYLVNFFGLANFGHRLEAYRRLPFGWSPAPTPVPVPVPTDLFMFAKFIAETELRPVTSLRVTALFLERPVGDATEAAVALHADWHEALLSDPSLQDRLQIIVDRCALEWRPPGLDPEWRWAPVRRD